MTRTPSKSASPRYAADKSLFVLERDNPWRGRADSNRRTGLCRNENGVRSGPQAYKGPGQTTCESELIQRFSYLMWRHGGMDGPTTWRFCSTPEDLGRMLALVSTAANSGL